MRNTMKSFPLLLCWWRIFSFFHLSCAFQLLSSSVGRRHGGGRATITKWQHPTTSREADGTEAFQEIAQATNGNYVNPEDTTSREADGTEAFQEIAQATNGNYVNPEDDDNGNQLLQAFCDDLEVLQKLRPPIPSADISQKQTIISAGSSYTRLWTHSTWENHGKAPLTRYSRHILRWAASTTARRILPTVLVAALWAAFVSLLATMHQQRTAIRLLGEAGSLVGGSLQLGSAASTALSTLAAPLALLLTLRANASMARLLEARQAWGRLVLNGRSLASLLHVYLMSPSSSNRKQDHAAAMLAARYLCILGWILKANLRGETDESQREVLSTMLPSQEVTWLLSQKNRPVAITSRLRQLITTAFARMQSSSRNNDSSIFHSTTTSILFVEDRIYQLETVVGIVERLFSSPIPPTYSRHLSRVLTTWLLLWPLSLATKIGASAGGFTAVGVILATVISTYVLVGIDEVGMEIEHSFQLLPLQQLSCALQDHVAEQFVGGAEMPEMP
jgi:predicted membrane chloride channel (bestrophin family)